MTQENELKRLESFVSKLLKSYQELKEENGRLSSDLQMRDKTIVNLKEQLEENSSERSEISNRVTGILEQIEEWEVNLGEELLDETPVSDASGRQGSLFSSVKVNDQKRTDQSNPESKFGE